MLFGDVLRGLIEDNDLTQKQLSKDLHMASSTLGHYVRNLREPDYDTLKRIAAYFHVSIDYLLNYQQKQGESQAEDMLLRAFHQMPPAQQRIFLAQSKAITKECAGPKEQD